MLWKVHKSRKLMMQTSQQTCYEGYTKAEWCAYGFSNARTLLMWMLAAPPSVAAMMSTADAVWMQDNAATDTVLTMDADEGSTTSLNAINVSKISWDKIIIKWYMTKQMVKKGRTSFKQSLIRITYFILGSQCRLKLLETGHGSAS